MTFTVNGVDLKSKYMATAMFKTAGSMYACGYNLYGQLGISNTTNRSSPTQVGSISSWSQISCGYYHSVSIQTNGTLWTWGNNSYGQLGTNNLTHRSSPVQVGTLSNWAQVSASNHTLAIKSDGTLWGWGYNSTGQLGFGGGGVSSPVQVGGLTNWKQASAGPDFSMFIKNDGTLWATGANGAGQLGLNDQNSRNSPVQVGSLLNNWKQISAGNSHNLAIKTDGTLWSWGNFGYGQLGTGSGSTSSTPVQIGTLSNWSQLSTGAGRTHSLAVKTDGTLWAWGNNSYGQLGTNDLTHRSSPVQVGTLSNWSKISGGLYITAAIKTDGTIWTWGNNSYGQLGTNDLTHRSSPVQVGNLNTWNQISCGYSTHMLFNQIV